MLVQFGQFLDHDLALSPEAEVHVQGEEGEADCCSLSRAQREREEGCFTIEVPPRDHAFPGVDCLVRNFKYFYVFCFFIICGKKISTCALIARISSVPHRSATTLPRGRGNSSTPLPRSSTLQTCTGPWRTSQPRSGMEKGFKICVVNCSTLIYFREGVGGLMKMRPSAQGNLLPPLNDDATAGDARALEQPGLTSVHALFVREHNRIAGEVRTITFLAKR